MIINLWSTPRTGSVWYSYFLRSQYPGSVITPEIFNPSISNVYYQVTKDGLLNRNYYEPGFFHYECILTKGELVVRKSFSERKRTQEEENERLLSLVKEASHNQTLIMHNHVSPIDLNVRNFLTDNADRNIYIYRKDKRAQLASYAIAFSTRKFVSFDNTDDEGIVPDIDILVLKNLIDRIKVWDSLPKDEVIAYEDISFENLPGFPIQQVKDYTTRLSDKMLRVIDELVLEYENS